MKQYNIFEVGDLTKQLKLIATTFNTIQQIFLNFFLIYPEQKIFRCFTFPFKDYHQNLLYYCQKDINHKLDNNSIIITIASKIMQVKRDPQQTLQQVFQLFQKYNAGVARDEVSNLIAQKGDSFQKWKQVSLDYIQQSQPFMEQLITILELVDPSNKAAIPQIILAYNQIQPLLTLQLNKVFITPTFHFDKLLIAKIDQDFKKRIQQNIAASANLQEYFNKEINEIIDILQKRFSIEKYFQVFYQASKNIQNPFTKSVQSMKFLDFIILLIKFVNSHDAIMFLLSIQAPLPIMFVINKAVKNDLKPCRSFLSCDKYPLIVNVGTKSALKINKTLPINLNSIKINQETIFQNNVNLSLLSDRTKVIIDFAGQFQNNLEMLNKLYQVTSLLVIHTTQEDFQYMLGNQNITNLFQSVEKLAIIIWNGQQPQQQIFANLISVLNQNSFIKKSINQFKGTAQSFIFVKRLSSQTPSALSKQLQLNQFVNSNLTQKRFQIQQFYPNNQDKLSLMLQNFNQQSIDKLLPGYNSFVNNQPSLFVKQSMDQINNNKQYSQLAFFAQKLSKFSNFSNKKEYQITTDKIVYQLNLYNEANIDRKKQVLISYQQQKIDRYYNQCLDNLHPFNVINDTTLQFGNGSLQRFFLYQKKYTEDKEIFVISLIGTKSQVKNVFINYLFGYNLYMREYPWARGLYLTICEINNKLILIFNTEEIFNFQPTYSEDKKLSFDHKLMVFLMRISNLILITSFNKDIGRLTESLKICSFIYQKICVNQNSDPVSLSKITLALPKSNQSQINKIKQSIEVLKVSINIQDIIFVPQLKNNKFQQDFSYAALNFRNHIFNFLRKPQQTSKKLVQIYRNQKIQWQIIKRIGQDLFRCQNFLKLSQQIHFITNNFKKIHFQNTQLNQRIINAQKTIIDELNEKPLQSQTNPQIQYQNVFCNSEILIEKLKLFESKDLDIINKNPNTIIKQLYWTTYKEMAKEECIDQIIKYSYAKVKQILKRNLYQNFDSLIQKVQDNVKHFVDIQTKKKKLITESSVILQLKDTFQIIFGSYQILKGLKINNIGQCLEYFNSLNYPINYNTNILNQLLIIQNEYSLLQKDRSDLNKLLQTFQKQTIDSIQQTHLQDTTKEINILTKFGDILDIINKNIQQCKEKLNQKSVELKNACIVNEINYKRFLIGRIFYFLSQAILQSKLNAFDKKMNKIGSIANEITNIYQEIKGIRAIYLSLKLFSYDRDIRPILIDKDIIININIADIALKKSIQADLKLGNKKKILEDRKKQEDKKIQEEKQKQKNVEESVDNNVNGKTAKKQTQDKNKQIQDINKNLDKQNTDKIVVEDNFSQLELSQLKRIYKNCYKIVKDSKIYLYEIKASFNFEQIYDIEIQKILAKKRELLNKKKQQIQSFRIRVQPIFTQHLAQDSYEEILKLTNQKQFEINLNLKNQRQTIDDFISFMNEKFSQSICQYQCHYCKAICHKKGYHQYDHQIRHYLKAFGGIVDQKKHFNMNLCPLEFGVNKYDTDQLVNIWVNIEQVMIQTKYTEALPTTKQQVVFWKNKACLTAQDIK